MHLANFIPFLVSFVIYFTVIDGSCPIQFRHEHNATLFTYFCETYLLPLNRVPEHHQNDVCYSKCLVATRCLFYTFNETEGQCIVCVRDPDVIDAQSVSAQLEPLDVEFHDLGPIQARIEASEQIKGNAMLTMNCSSAVFGGFELTNAIDIPPTSQIRQWHFCSSDISGGNNRKIRGFNLTIDEVSANGTSTYITYQVLCENGNWSTNEPMNFEQEEYISAIDLYFVSNMSWKGVQVTTNRRQFPGSGLTNGVPHTVEGGQKLRRIEWFENKSSSSVRGLSFHFQKCD